MSADCAQVFYSFLAPFNPQDHLGGKHHQPDLVEDFCLLCKVQLQLESSYADFQSHQKRDPLLSLEAGAADTGVRCQSASTRLCKWLGAAVLPQGPRARGAIRTPWARSPLLCLRGTAPPASRGSLEFFSTAGLCGGGQFRRKLVARQQVGTLLHSQSSQHGTLAAPG